MFFSLRLTPSSNKTKLERCLHTACMMESRELSVAKNETEGYIQATELCSEATIPIGTGVARTTRHQCKASLRLGPHIDQKAVTSVVDLEIGIWAEICRLLSRWRTKAAVSTCEGMYMVIYNPIIFLRIIRIYVPGIRKHVLLGKL